MQTIEQTAHDRKAAYNKTYRNAHHEELRAKSKEYYLKNKDEKKMISRDYYQKHRLDRIAYSKLYQKTHSEKHAAYMEKYRSDHHDHLTKLKENDYYEKNQIDIICVQCGENASVSCRISGKFCSHECARKYQSGAKSPHWKGGISTWPYCPKFTELLKEEVRNTFSRTCFLSGTKENGKRLAVHHCDYLKSQGCKGQRWSLLPLEKGWHSKTNANRWYWFALLRDYWVYKYLIFHGMDIFEGPDRTTWLWEMYNNGSN